MDKIVASISQRLREALDSAGKKQIDLVRETGLDRGTISSYLSGRYEPKQASVHKMALALNVSEAWLLGYDVPKKRAPEHKKDDQLSKLIVQLSEDAIFYNRVCGLADLNEKQLKAIDSLLAAFQE